jgi:phospholipase C
MPVAEHLILARPTRGLRVAIALVPALTLLPPALAAEPEGLGKVNHIVVVMQENHSFDNYFGVLAYAPGSPYHPPPSSAAATGKESGGAGCAPDDHLCVDGLTCAPDPAGGLVCSESNLDDDGTLVHPFHATRRCTVPDLDHSWFGTHAELNFSSPADSLITPLNDGFVRVNDLTEQPDHGTEGVFEDETMAFFDQTDLPFYYELAEQFALGDRYFASVPGPTFPNRAYLMAGTSFGHLTTNDELPPMGGYKPVNGTIFDLLDAHGVTWADYYQNLPQGFSFRPFFGASRDPHFQPLSRFMKQAAGARTLPPLPQVVFVDPNFGPTVLFPRENDEHPPTDIQRGQAFVSRVLNALRRGPHWRDTIVLLTYDEHGGFHDHVAPPRAPQGEARTPDGIAPGQCADLSNPPASLLPGGVRHCATNLLSRTDTSVADAEALCPALSADPTGPYPDECPAFDQLGVRVPLLAISPFAKPHYVSHAVADHASILALIERRFLSAPGGGHLYLTARDRDASTLEDLFDFDAAPSLDAAIGRAMPPVDDCTP